jgi:hypothetical protein
MEMLLEKIRAVPGSPGSIPADFGGQDRSRVRAAVLVVKLEKLTAATRAPEDLAELRELLIAGPSADRKTVESLLPDAVVPTAPAVPTGGLPPAPAGHPQASWPAELLQTIYLSLADRNTGMPGSRFNIPEAFGGTRPANLWDALKAMGGATAVIKQIYDRWSASGIPWSHAHSIRNSWSGSSTGFNFNSSTVTGLRAALEKSTKFCKDKNGGDLYHDFVEGTAPCWRECVTANTPGLHFCIGGSVPTVHIDDHQCVEYREDDGTCNYDLTAVKKHWQDLGWLPKLPI